MPEVNYLNLYCANCGAKTITYATMPNDDRKRKFCTSCESVFYENPNVVVGAICTKGDKILLCERDIEPRRGFWTMPAGFLENGESLEEGTLREAYEEANAKLAIQNLLGTFSIRHLKQVHIVYHAKLLNDDIQTTFESSQVELFPWENIPWQDLAFPVVRWALECFQQQQESQSFQVFSAAID